MKKILSVLLIFVLTLTVAGLRENVQAEATADATIYFHIHQFDGDYTGTGIGIWDGRDDGGWNGWADVVDADASGAADGTEVDAFGGIVAKTYTAAQINDAKFAATDVAGSLQLEITRSANAADDAGKQAGLLAPGNGKVFVDVSSLIDGSVTELHVYYVEASTSAYVVEGPVTNGLFFNVYTNPKVVSDEMVYDGWGMHTWNNGMPGIDYFENPNKYEIEMELQAGEFLVPARLGVIEVADGNTGNAGFIAHFGENADEELKSCYSDMFFDTDDLLALDGKAQVVYYLHGECEFTPEIDTYLDLVEELYDYYSGNAILDGTQIVDPSTISVNFSMFKNPAQLDLSRFMLKDSEGNDIPLVGVNPASMHKLGTFTSTATAAEGEYRFVLYVATDLDHSKLGIVGSLQGWDPGNAVTSLGDDDMGNAVFEIFTTGGSGSFKLLYDEDGTFEWGGNTVEITKENQAFDMNNDAMAGVFFIDVESVDAMAYTETVDLAPEIERYVKVFVDTTLSHDDLFIVGSFNAWDVANPNTLTEDSSAGYAVLEFATGDAAASFKLLHDTEGDASYGWGDFSFTADNIDLDLSGANEFNVFISYDGTDTTVQVFPNPGTAMGVDPADYTYTSTTTCVAGEELLTLFVNADEPHAELGIVGSLQGWDIGNTVASIGDTDSGLAVFEICQPIDGAGEYKVVHDSDGTFEWGGNTVELTPSNVPFNLGNFKAYVVQGEDNLGTFTPSITPQVTIKRLVRLYVNTDMDHTKLGIVGTLNNWDIANPIPIRKVQTTDYSMGWRAFLNTWEGSAGSISIVDGELVFDITNIAAMDAGWKLQVIQDAFALGTGADNDGSIQFEAGKTYKVTFDAAASVAGDVTLAIGHSIGGWNPYHVEAVTLGTEMASYSVEFTLDDAAVDYTTLAQLKFEMGTLFSGQTTGQFMLDNVMIEVMGETEYEDTEQIVNGTFQYVQDGLAYFEMVSTTEDIMFKLVYDEDGTFEWGGNTVELTPANQEFTIGSSNEIVLYINGDTATYLNMDLGFADAMQTDLMTNMFTLDVDPMYELHPGEEYMLYYVEELATVTHVVEDETEMPELFISEYIEGSSNNKALEIYNPTTEEVDLTPYSIVEWYGTDVDPDDSNIYDLTGTLGAGETLVLCTNQVTEGNGLDGKCDIEFAYPSVVHFNGDDAVLLMKDDVVIDQIGSTVTAGDGNKFLGDITLVRNMDVYHGNPEYTATEWTEYAQDTFDYIGMHKLDIPVPEFVIMYGGEEAMALPFGTDNELVEADVVAEMGTYALTPTTVQVQFATSDVYTAVIKDAEGTEVSVSEITNAYRRGLFAATVTCPTGESKLYIHVKLRETELTAMAQLGVVGSLQDWNIDDLIAPVGMDTMGNYVFEICLAEGVTSGEFKVKFDPDSDGFTWDGGTDPEITPANIPFDLANDNHVFVLEFESAPDTVDTHVYTLSAGTELDKDGEYYVEFTDVNGFVMSVPLDLDNEAPVVQYTRRPGVELTFNDDQPLSEFDLMDYYSILTFVDTRDGDLGYTIDNELDLSTAGPQTITISAVDAWDNEATFNITITVVHIDNEAPTFTGDSELTLTVGDAEPDWASLVTISDGTLSVNESQVDLTSAGSFFVIYTATDDAGNSATFNLEVTVEAADVEPEPEDTGCFGTLNIANTLITVVMVALGGAVILVVRKR